MFNELQIPELRSGGNGSRSLVLWERAWILDSNGHDFDIDHLVFPSYFSISLYYCNDFLDGIHFFFSNITLFRLSFLPQ